MQTKRVRVKGRRLTFLGGWALRAALGLTLALATGASAEEAVAREPGQGAEAHLGDLIREAFETSPRIKSARSR